MNRNTASTPAPPADGHAQDTLLSVYQVAERLNVSTATVHRLIEVRDLGHVRIGIRTIRVPESVLANYIERCTVRCLH